MGPLKIGVQLKSLRLPFRQAVPVAARLGAAAVEIDARGELRPGELSQTGLRQVRKLLEDHRLSVCAVGFATRHGYADRENLEARIEATKAALRFAFDLRAPVVVNHVGRIPSESTGPEWELLTSVLRELGTAGQMVGARLAAETGSEPPADLARLLDALPEQTVGVNLDPASLIGGGQSPRAAVELLGPRILHVHARDGVRDLAHGGGLETALGRGACDFAELAGALAEHDYRGYFTVERTTSDDPLADVGQAVEFLQGL
jgi:sugar phosphate isomerase/epimerase